MERRKDFGSRKKKREKVKIKTGPERRERIAKVADSWHA